MLVKMITAEFYNQLILEKKLKTWIEKNWYPFLEYVPRCHTLVQGWLSFHFKDEGYVEAILKERWYLGLDVLTLKMWVPGLHP
jgi:hypothetical protein